MTSTVTPPAPDILSPEYLADPYPLHRVLRDSHPVTFHEATQSWLISRYADVAAAFRTPAFSSRNYEWQLEPIHGRTILQMEGKEHATHRALLNPFFRGKGLEAFLPVITRDAAELVDGVVARAAGDLVDGFAGRGRVEPDGLALVVDDHGPVLARPRLVGVLFGGEEDVARGRAAPVLEHAHGGRPEVGAGSEDPGLRRPPEGRGARPAGFGLPATRNARQRQPRDASGGGH